MRDCCIWPFSSLTPLWLRSLPVPHPVTHIIIIIIIANMQHHIVSYCFYVIMQTSTSVQQTTEVAALMPAALTLQVAPRVPVYLVTPEMDLPAQVSQD